MNKVEICQEAIKNIMNATQMEVDTFDEKTQKKITKVFEVTDIARKSAIDAITRYQDYDSNRMLIYHGNDSAADYLYYLEIEEGYLSVIKEIDFGMRIHRRYYTPEKILYAFNELEETKTILSSYKKSGRRK